MNVSNLESQHENRCSIDLYIVCNCAVVPYKTDELIVPLRQLAAPLPELAKQKKLKFTEERNFL